MDPHHPRGARERAVAVAFPCCSGASSHTNGHAAGCVGSLCPHLEHGRERERESVCACVAILTMINRICTRSRGLACRGSMFPLRVFILTIMQEMPSLRKVFLKRQHQRTADCIEHMGKNPIFACARAGVEGNQIVFSDMAREHEFLDMALAADLFLDTPPCNAHTTAT